ncbi:MAG: P-loop NTPase [Acidimicrobiia bacterium]
MIDSQAVRAELARVLDPLLGRGLDSLGMVREVDTGLLGSLKVVLAVPVPNYPGFEELDRRVRVALEGITGARSAKVEMLVMGDDERSQLMGRLRATGGPGIGETGSPTRVVAISSGKGGVGKSSVSTNLAVALANLGHTVGVIDADVWGFSIPRMLGVTHPPVVIDQSIIPPTAHGVKAMSMDYFVADDQAVIWRGPMLHKAIEQFLKDVFWDDPELLIVDMPPGTGDVAISLSQFTPRAQVLVVTTPQPTAQRVARRAALMAEKVNQEVMGVVENMSWFTGDDGTSYEIFGEGGGRALAEDLGVPLLAQIPLVAAMREGADHGRPVAAALPGSEVEQAFRKLAEEVVARKPRVRTHPELVIR